MKAIILIFIGLVLLLNNLEVLPWGAWETIFKLWPLILIILGLKIIRPKVPQTDYLLFIIGLFILGFLLAYLLLTQNFLAPLHLPELLKK